MANTITWNDTSPGDTDDVQEGAQRIRESKKMIAERLARDHYLGVNSGSDPNAMQASNDTGYHRRVTINENANGYASTATTRIATVNGGSQKMSEIYMENNSGGDDQILKYASSAGTTKEVVTTTQPQSLSNKTLSAPVIQNPQISGGSGTLDGVNIGATTQGSGKFTTVESTGNATFGNSTSPTTSFSHSSALPDTITLKAETPGVRTNAGAGKMYAGITGEIKMFASATAPAGWLNCDGSTVLRADYPELFAIIGHTYSDLSASSTNGSQVPDSSLQFRLPNMQGRIPVGAGTGVKTGTSGNLDTSNNALTARTIGDYADEEETTLTGGQSGTSAHHHAAYIHMDDHQHEFMMDDMPNYGDMTRIGSTNQNYDAESDGSFQHQFRYYTSKAAGTGNIQPTSTSVTENKHKTADSTEANADDGHTNFQPCLVLNYIIKV